VQKQLAEAAHQAHAGQTGAAALAVQLSECRHQLADVHRQHALSEAQHKEALLKLEVARTQSDLGERQSHALVEEVKAELARTKIALSNAETDRRAGEELVAKQALDAAHAAETIAVLKASVEQGRADTEALRQRCESMVLAREGLETNVGRVADMKAAADEAVNLQQETIGGLQTLVRELAASETALKGKVEALAAAEARARQQADRAAAGEVSLQGRVAALGTSIRELQARVTSLQEANAGLTLELQTARGRLRGELDHANGQITAQSSMSIAQIRSLRKQLDKRARRAEKARECLVTLTAEMDELHTSIVPSP
jgi:chromosome segregation ATPase